MSRPRIIAYDALRLFAIVTVVAIHTLMPYRATVPPHAPVRVLDYLLHYAVPLFVFLSGVFVWSRPLPSRPGAYADFLQRRLAVIGIPYLVWSALYLALLAERSATPLSLQRILGLLLTGHTWYHLYFIPMLITFYLLTPVATRISARSPELLVLGAYALRLLAGPAVAEAFRSAFGDLGWSYATHIVTHLPHMALGAWFAARGSRLPRSAWFSAPLLLAGFAVLLGVDLGFTSELPTVARRLVQPAGMAAVVLGMTLLALRLEPVLERRLGRMVIAGAALAFGVYFVHPLLLLGVDAVIAARSAESLWMHAWFPIAVFSAVSAASFAISWVLSRSPLAPYLVGTARPAEASARTPGSG